MTCPHCLKFLRKFYRAGDWVRVCPKCQPYRTARNIRAYRTFIPTAEIVQMYESGMTRGQIAAKTGMLATTVHSRLANARKTRATEAMKGVA